MVVPRAVAGMLALPRMLSDGMAPPKMCAQVLMRTRHVHKLPNRVQKITGGETNWPPLILGFSLISDQFSKIGRRRFSTIFANIQQLFKPCCRTRLQPPRAPSLNTRRQQYQERHTPS
jgi:hypothetical protein